MTKFPHIRIEYVGPNGQGRTLWLVLEGMEVEHPLLPLHYSIGFNWQTDLASVPRVALLWLIAGGDAPASAVVHDWLYKTGFLSRMQADRVFRDLIQIESYSVVKAWILWSGVRLGGWWTWRKYRKGER